MASVLEPVVLEPVVLVASLLSEQQHDDEVFLAPLELGH